MIKTLILIFISSFFFFQGDFRQINNTSFLPGEGYQYKIKYGILTIGEAIVDVDSKVFTINGRICYKVSVIGKTAGMTTLFKVKNSYVSYIDTSAFVPHKFFYSARENNYKRDQVIDFNHQKNEVIKTEKDERKSFKIPNNCLDVVSGYYFLRTVDFSKYSLGGTFTAPLFFDEEQYSMKVKYAGKGTINSKFGKIKVLKLNPVLPNNKLFEGENAIRIWVSDDANRVPIKIEVDFSIGTIDMDLKSHKGMRYPFKLT